MLLLFVTDYNELKTKPSSDTNKGDCKVAY